ncbi:SRPBCC family protein [Rugosimonospora africana]|nr:SRPBCC family protein [Rugosimonospora africana]
MTDGELERIDDRWRLRFSRRLAHTPEKVWRALTEPEHLAAWFPTTIEGDRAAGASLRFAHPEGKGPAFTGTMIAYQPPSLMEFEWGTDTLRFELRPDGDGTVLTLLDLFDEQGKAARDAAGWHVCLDLLGVHLDGEPAPDDRLSGWAQANADYTARFGPEAATIGPPGSAGA